MNYIFFKAQIDRASRDSVARCTLEFVTEVEAGSAGYHVIIEFTRTTAICK